jgi:hypothetical protein
VAAVTLSGIVCRFSERRWDVTTISLSSLGLFSTTVAPETSAGSGLAYADNTKIIEDADEIRADRCAIVFGTALLPDGAVYSFAGRQLRSSFILDLVEDSKVNL